MLIYQFLVWAGTGRPAGLCLTANSRGMLAWSPRHTDSSAPTPAARPEFKLISTQSLPW